MRVYKVEGWVGGPLKDKYGKTHFQEPVHGSEVLVIDLTPESSYGRPHSYIRILPDGIVETSFGLWPPDGLQIIPARFIGY
jgi:hypothetical protein